MAESLQAVEFPTVTGNEWDVIVVGAGVLGAFHAYFARCKGLRTLLIERSHLPGEASVRNFGMIAASGMSQGDWHNRGLESAAIYRQLAERFSFGFQTGGSHYLATTPNELLVLQEFARLGPAKGYRCELLDRTQSVAINPAINPESCLASLFFPDDVRIDPRQFLKNFVPWLAKSFGCAYLPDTVVTQVKTSGDGCRILTANGAEHLAKNVFVCSGADLKTLFPDYFSTTGLLQCKLLMLKTEPQPKLRLGSNLGSGLTLRRYPAFRISPSWSKLRDEHVDPELLRQGIHILMVQDEDGRVIVGDSHEYGTHGLDERLSAQTEALIIAEAQRISRLENWNISQRWHGIYSLHPEQELLRKTLDDRIHLVTGIGGKGMTTGPAVARESIDGIV